MNDGNIEEIYRCCSCNRDRTGENIMVRLRLGVILCGECVTSACEVVVRLREKYPKDYKLLQDMVETSLDKEIKI